MKNVFSRDMIQDNWHQCALYQLSYQETKWRFFIVKKGIGKHRYTGVNTGLWDD